MMPFRALPALLLLAGCVAPEPPPVPRPVPSRAEAPTPPRTDLEPAPRANRGMKAPEGPSVMQVEGMGRPKQPLLP